MLVVRGDSSLEPAGSAHKRNGRLSCLDEADAEAPDITLCGDSAQESLGVLHLRAKS